MSVYEVNSGFDSVHISRRAPAVFRLWIQYMLIIHVQITTDSCQALL